MIATASPLIPPARVSVLHVGEVPVHEQGLWDWREREREREHVKTCDVTFN